MAIWTPWDLVVVISPSSHVERRERFLSSWAKSKLMSPHKIVVYDAATPETCPSPSWFKPGYANEKSAPYHWCARMAQHRILEECLIDKLQHVLIFEDDAFFVPEFDELFHHFFEQMPDDWTTYKLYWWRGTEPIVLPDKPNCVRLTHTGGAQAMGHNPKGLRAYYDALWSKPWEHGDISLNEFAVKEGTVYGTVPLMTEHFTVPSTLQCHWNDP